MGTLPQAGRRFWWEGSPTPNRSPNFGIECGAASVLTQRTPPGHLANCAEETVSKSQLAISTDVK
jgi:hypothetical protein